MNPWWNRTLFTEYVNKCSIFVSSNSWESKRKRHTLFDPLRDGTFWAEVENVSTVLLYMKIIKIQYCIFESKHFQGNWGEKSNLKCLIGGTIAVRRKQTCHGRKWFKFLTCKLFAAVVSSVSIVCELLIIPEI